MVIPQTPAGDLPFPNAQNRDGKFHVATWNVFGNFQSDIKRPILIIELAKRVVEKNLDIVFLQDTQIKNEEHLLNQIERNFLI